ncbi:helix-turn-helix transcriptional regulator [Lederbergia lenta]|uniref:AraC family transcriptional regulator n=1 Tax=Lederbergia lenta TaxID=1467 RepID=A0A2X4W368_LEDLE|nr:AraC family transcriptional regulator [Lederbergia lenta]MEC2324860.1 AraC family transcriptional regulator [Lederbergia lenta]SQI57139.1 AraC family transcriptional regulator [Lederbergia lenta]
MQLQKTRTPITEVHLYENQHHRGNHISDHYHDHFQILYALNGEGELTLDDKKYEFSKDRVVLIVPNSVHSITAHAKLSVLVLAFSPTALGHHIEEGLLNGLQQHSQHYQLDVVRASEVRQILRKILFEQTDYDPLCKYAAPVYLYELLLILIRFNKEKKSEDANDMRSLRLRNYIDTRYFENITAENLSATFGISTRYINDIFKSKFHETPLQYLQKVRINRAKELLIESDKDIVSICFEVGYETLSTFYRTFRNIVGMSPNKFRTIKKESIE